MRIGEVVRLQVRDYDTTNATLTIRETKFAKTRLVPVSRSARRIIDEYLTRRQRLGLSCVPDSPLRCCPSDHSPCVRAVQSALADLMRQCGIKPPRGRGPRVHDMRHTFAVERIRQWYREGKDVQRLIPHLVTYLGHRSLESTQLYLSVTPAVLDATIRGVYQSRSASADPVRCQVHPVKVRASCGATVPEPRA